MENTTLCDISALVTALAAAVVLIIKGMHASHCKKINVCCGAVACERKKIKKEGSERSASSTSSDDSR